MAMDYGQIAVAFLVSLAGGLIYVVLKGWNQRMIFYRLQKQGLVRFSSNLNIIPGRVTYSDLDAANATMEPNHRPLALSRPNSQ